MNTKYTFEIEIQLINRVLVFKHCYRNFKCLIENGKGK